MLDPTFEIDRARWDDRVRKLVSEDLSEERTKLVRELARRILQETIQRTPVETAEARAAWVSILEQLGGSPPAGWEGDHPDSAYITAGRQSAEIQALEHGTITELRLTNGVPHVLFLEYGTRSQPAVSAVRHSLATIQREVSAGLFLARKA